MVFFWVLQKDRLSTKDLLRRRYMNLPGYHCVLSNIGSDESIEHLFINCLLICDDLLGYSQRT
jgi:hypothetical protein